nr:hypothetical protein [uncultured Chryseobacterium sp.]
MKTLHLFIICILLSQIWNAQKTKVLIVDLASPHERSVKFMQDTVKVKQEKNTSERDRKIQEENKDSICLKESKWLSVKPNELIALKLINGNPLKYKYTINNNEITYFMDTKKINEDLALINNISTKKAEYDSIAYKNLPFKNDSLKKSIKELQDKIEKFELIYINTESLNIDDFSKNRTTLFQELINLRAEADKNLSCYEEGIEGSYKNLLSEEQRKDVKKDVKENLTRINIIAQKFKDKFFFSNEFYTLPIDVQAKNIDAVEFAIIRTDKTTNQEDKGFSSKYRVWINGGLKIDISAGVFLTSLYDEEYEARDIVGNTTDKQIMLKKRGDYDFAFGSTINTNFRFNSWIQPQINFGFVFTQNQKFQLLFGGGIIFGREERWILSGGLSMGVVDRLANGFENEKPYNLGTSGQIPIVKQFKFGHFLGITYNLSKVNSISVK